MKAKLLLISSMLLVISGSFTSCSRKSANAGPTAGQDPGLSNTFQRMQEKKEAERQQGNPQAEADEQKHQQPGQAASPTPDENKSVTSEEGQGGPSSSSTISSRFGDSSYKQKYNSNAFSPWGASGSNSAIPGQPNTSPGARQAPFSTAGRPAPVIPPG